MGRCKNCYCDRFETDFWQDLSDVVTGVASFFSSIFDGVPIRSSSDDKKCKCGHYYSSHN